MRVATAIGLLWSVALVTSGMVWNYGMTTVVALAKTDPAQAQLVWQAIEPVSSALGGAGGEILGGLWVLLVSVVALRGGALPKLLGWFGIVFGVAGLVSVIPPLHDAAIVFGLLLIVWFVWVGVTLVTTKATAAEPDRAQERRYRVRRSVSGQGCVRHRETRVSRRSGAECADQPRVTRQPLSRRDTGMTTNERTTDTRSMQTRLSTLWVFIMFNMVFADILSFMYPGGLKEVLTGYAGGVQITPAFLLGAAVVTEIPIAMIVLSRILKQRANRWANIVAGVITIVYVVGGGPLNQIHYIFFAAVEVAAALLIIRYAWTWREPETATIPAVRAVVER